MKAEERRRRIAQTLTATTPISATTLAEQFSVSRQIIVGDIALLRAAGMDIVSTPRGYQFSQENGLLRTVACLHTPQQIRQELLVMVDNGCTVLDVVVDHPVYGQLTGQLSLASRYDVDQFVDKVQDTAPLSTLTGGVHLHTLCCPDEKTFHRIEAALENAGVLYKKE